MIDIITFTLVALALILAVFNLYRLFIERTRLKFYELQWRLTMDQIQAILKGGKK